MFTRNILPLCTAWLILAAVPSQAVEPNVDAAFAAHVKAIQSRDLAALALTISDAKQLILILPNGRLTKTRQEYLDFHKEFFASKSWTIRFDPVATSVGSDFAVLTTKSLYEDLQDGNPVRTRSWVTFIFHKEAGKWRLIHDQNTRVAAGE
ncbi:MAG: YybH family protein [Steroidobacteraceae bacterium]